MKRGDIFTAATGSGFGRKPRPVLIIQSDAFSAASKILVALIGSPFEASLPIRVEVTPDFDNNLKKTSHVMVDSILPVRKDEFGRHVGRLSAADMRRVDTALLLMLDIGVSA